MMDAASSAAPFRPVDWAARDTEMTRRDDGCIILRTRIPLDAYAPHLPSWLTRWADARRETTWLAEREGEHGWRRLTYGEGKAQVDALTQALLDLVPPGEDGPVAILSDNSIAHAVVTVAAMQARLPAAPISPAYSLASRDHGKLKHIFELVRPSVVFVEDGALYGPALAALNLGSMPVIYVRNRPAVPNAHRLDDLLATAPTDAVQRSIAAITPDTDAKFLFTSGSTGVPKAVINTQRMICANQQMLDRVRPLPEVAGERAVLEWLPWNHTMAGNGTFGMILMKGYTLYIDDGRPTPALMERTIANLREISPIQFTNAPIGYAALVTAMESDEALCRSFFANLLLLGYGGARLPDDLYDRIQELAVRTTGYRIAFISYYGATETGPLSTMTYWATERTGFIGLPLPGVELKLVPFDGGKYELRQRSVTITPGYHGRDDLTRDAFDDEGFYKLGDLVTFADASDVNEGLMFAGRLAEEFKLLTGTFVPVSAVRVGAVAAVSPVLLDAVVTGQDQSFVGLLAWLNVPAARKVAGLPDATAEQLVENAAIRAVIANGLAGWNAAQNGASSLSVARILLLVVPPAIDAGEITDKGYINQRAVTARRAAEVDRIHADHPDDDVIVISKSYQKETAS